MTCDLVALAIDANDPRRVAEFWAGVLGWELDDSGVAIGLPPADDTGFRLRFPRTLEPRVGANQFHFDIRSESPEQQRETVARALALGGRHHDVGQLPEEEHVVLADPEGNEFCVIEAGNNFLAGCGILGELAGEGTRDVGLFWSEALGWPLVWDQDEETAIQSPRGGTKVAWGGPPVAPLTPGRRQRYDLTAEGDLAREVNRLVSLGATRIRV